MRPGVAGRLQKRCPQGHRLSLAKAGLGWDPSEWCATVTCHLCREMRAPRAAWILMNPAEQYVVGSPMPERQPVLIVQPPRERAGVGVIRLRRHRVVVGEVDVSICGPCRRAVLENIRVSEVHRRRGYGLVLLAAALARAPADQYEWSTTPLHDTVAARAFWSIVEFPGTLGTPNYCTDMHGRSDRRSTTT